MQNNKEIIKYIVSSIWSSWNPINWSPSMQLATLSYILSCLIDVNDAYSIEDAQIINNDQEWLKINQTYTFYNTQFPSSRYVELAKEIPICLKRLKIFHKFDDENYVPNEALASHKLINNFSNLLKHFKLTPLIDPTDFNPNYFMVWSWAKNLGNITKYFGQKLKRVCNNIEEAENYWESYEPEAFSNFSTFHEFISTITHCNDALLGCRDIRSDIYYNEL